MEVIVPRVDAEGKAVMVRPAQEKHDGLAERHKNPAKVGDLVSLKNREPKWNPASNMYQLDFQGRATMASCKNIQLHAKVRANPEPNPNPIPKPKPTPYPDPNPN